MVAPYRPIYRPVYRGMYRPVVRTGALDAPPADLVQLLLAPREGDSYYSEDEWSSYTHLLADRSKLAGDVRDKRESHCLDFNGVDQHIDNITTDIVPQTTSFSFSLWLKFDNLSATQQIVAQQDGAAGTGRTWLYFDFANSEMRCFIGTLILSSGLLPVVGTWYHMAVTWDHVAGTVTLNSNGTTENRTGLTGNDGDGAIRIGSSKVGSDPFDGKAYDFRLYSGKVLSADEIEYLRTYGQSGTDPGTDELVTHYWMQEESGSTTYDASGADNDATITNYLSSMRVTDSGVRYNVANEVGHSLSGAAIVPPVTGSTTVDAEGNALTYRGRVPMVGLAKHAAWQRDAGGTIYLEIPGFTAATTVSSFAGSTTSVTPGTDRLDWDNGTTLGLFTVGNATYVPIDGTRDVAKITSDGSDTTILVDAVKNGTLASLHTLGDGSWRLPHIENGARWDGSSLLPLDPLGNSPDGSDGNIAAGTLDRYGGIRVDRTGGTLSPLDYELGLDGLTSETGEQWVENIEGDW